VHDQEHELLERAELLALHIPFCMTNTAVAQDPR
jgi:hypothetical protein